MQELLDILNKLGGIGTLIGFTFLLIHQLPRLYDSITYIKSKKLIEMQKAIKSDFIDDDLSNVLQELIANEYLQQSTGVKVNSTFARNFLINLYQSSKGEINFVHMKRANYHLIYKDGKIQVEISWFDKKTKLFAKYFGWMTAFFGIFLFTIIWENLLTTDFTKALTSKEFSMFFNLGVYLVSSIILTLSSFKMYLEVDSAEKIQDYLEKKNLDLLSTEEN